MVVDRVAIISRSLANARLAKGRAGRQLDTRKVLRSLRLRHDRRELQRPLDFRLKRVLEPQGLAKGGASAPLR